MDRLRFANDREQHASRLLEQRAVSVRATAGPAGVVLLAGQVKDGPRSYAPELTLDADGRLVQATCTCNFFQQNKLFKGPCEHMLATRLARASH